MTTYLPLPRPGGDADTMRVQHGLLRYVREAAALGAPLPGELELTARLECSRQQLRNAMAQLEAQGIVRRRQGTVTTVDPIALRLSVRLEEQFEHTELLDRLGYHAEVEVLESRTLPLGAEIGAVMERPADTTRLAVRKRWRADGAVAMIADENWTLTGREVFVSGSEAADHMLVNTSIDGVPAFFGVTVDDSISFPPIDETVGMRATRSRTVLFENTPLLASRRCGFPPADYANLITVGFGMLSIGIAESAMDAYAAAARKSKGGAPSQAENQWVQMETGMLWTQLQAARLFAERVAWLADERSEEAMPAAAESKMLANEVAKQAAAEALRVGGGGSFLLSSPIQRIFRDAQAGALMAYSVPLTQQVVGEAVLTAD